LFGTDGCHASAKHFVVKVIKYFAVMCINAAVTGSQFPVVTNFQVMRLLTSVVIIIVGSSVAEVDELELTSPTS